MNAMAGAPLARALRHSASSTARKGPLSLPISTSVTEPNRRSDETRGPLRTPRGGHATPGGAAVALGGEPCGKSAIGGSGRNINASVTPTATIQHAR